MARRLAPAVLAASLVLPLAAVTGGIGASVASAAEAVPSDTIFIDTNNATPDTAPAAAGQVTRTWPAGTALLATVTGTWSRWEAAAWTAKPYCGTPEASPSIPGPERTQGLIGRDAEVEFAHVDVCTTDASSVVPRASDDVQFLTPTGFAHVQAVGGARTTPTAGHAYSYPLTSTGAPVALRIRDDFPSDNYGRIQLTVRQAFAPDCAGDAWTFLGGYPDAAACAAALGPVPGAAAGDPNAPVVVATPKASLRLTLPRSIVAGRPLALTGQVAVPGVAVTTLRPEIWVRPAGKRWSKAATLRATAAGKVTFSTKPVFSTTYQLRLAGRSEVSPIRLVGVAPLVRVNAPKTPLRAKAAAKITGTVTPVRVGTRVELWAGTKRLTSTSVVRGGSFSLSYRPAKAGRATLVVRVPKSAYTELGAARVILTAR